MCPHQVEQEARAVEAHAAQNLHHVVHEPRVVHRLRQLRGVWWKVRGLGVNTMRCLVCRAVGRRGVSVCTTNARTLTVPTHAYASCGAMTLEMDMHV